MSAINFKEIPEAHLGSGLQDTFELFARDFLSYLGYVVAGDPSRGPDGGKDVVVHELRSGVGGESRVRWLVSCKHKAHSGSSVTPQDELNIRDRIEANRCDGFIGFYSTLPSSGLAATIEGLSEKSEAQLFDREKIEALLLDRPEGIHLAKRYFPESTAIWSGENPSPARVFPDLPILNCRHCGKNLLNPKPSGIIVIWQRRDEVTGKTHHEQIYWCCKGDCDRRLRDSARAAGFVDGWEDIPDVAIPIVFAKWMVAPLNKLYGGDTYTQETFEQLKEFILSVYPYVTRNATQEEQERIDGLTMIPSFLGGLGY